ncbi:MAG: PTS glucose transporter subunit IIA [Oscillospiraceae bacterium]|nr:PTS glucose transporter subunit IIA [Oscillospiraceae bacterium]
MFGLKSKKIIIPSPLNGDVIDISKLSDPVFSDDILGKGIAILPKSGRIISPADALITMMFDTGHAVSLETETGVELLIHVGIDTVKLKGAHYTICKNTDDKVKAGDVLMTFDAEAIAAEGYETVTPVVVCNPDKFKSVSFVQEGPIKEGEPLITLKI